MLRPKCPAFVFALLLSLTACAPLSIKHEFSMAPGQAHHSDQTSVLLIPINRTTRPPAGIGVSDAKIEDLIESHLRSKGLAVERVTAQKFQKTLDIAIGQAQKKMMSGESGSVSATLDFESLVPFLTEALGSRADLIVVPNLAMRSGKYSGGTIIRWDGVRRRESTRRSMTGSTSVASLHVVIYEPEGPRLFSAYGGLDRLFELSISKKKYILIESRLQDERNLKEGVCIAFHPFFGPSERC